MADVFLTRLRGPGYFSTRIVYPDPNLQNYLFWVKNIVAQLKKKTGKKAKISS